MDPKRAKRLIANRQVTHDVEMHHVAPGRPHETVIMALLRAALSLACGHWLFHQIAGRYSSACKLSSMEPWLARKQNRMQPSCLLTVLLCFLAQSAQRSKARKLRHIMQLEDEVASLQGITQQQTQRLGALQQENALLSELSPLPTLSLVCIRSSDLAPCSRRKLCCVSAYLAYSIQQSQVTLKL